MSGKPITQKQAEIIKRALSDAYDDRMGYARSGAGEYSEEARKQAMEYAKVLKDLFGEKPAHVEQTEAEAKIDTVPFYDVKPNDKIGFGNG